MSKHIVNKNSTLINILSIQVHLLIICVRLCACCNNTGLKIMVVDLFGNI